MHSLVIHFQNQALSTAILLSSLLKIKGKVTRLQLSNDDFIGQKLDELFHLDTHVLLINRDFINNSTLLLDFLSTNKASDDSPLVIPILLEDIQPFPLKLGKSNRFLLNQDYTPSIEFILDKIDFHVKNTRKETVLPSPFEATNLN